MAQAGGPGENILRDEPGPVPRVTVVGTSGWENSKRTGEPGLAFRGPTVEQSFVPMLLVLRPRRSLLAILLLHIEYKSQEVAPETLPGMTTAMQPRGLVLRLSCE